MSAADVDAVLPVPALVFGSLPPAGRDLDLLVRRADADAVRDALGAAGLVPRPRAGTPRTWARFAGGSAYAVDVVVLEEWAPSPAVGELVWRAATPLDGWARLLVPAPAHRLLLLARRVVGGLRVDERRRRDLAAFDDAAWAEAAEQALAWGCAAALAELRAPGPSVEASASASASTRRGRARVVALSGLDGSGKSTQADLLRDALEALGHDATTTWSKIARDRVLERVARPVKRVVALLPGRSTSGGPVDGPTAALVDEAGEERRHPDGPPPPPDAGSLARRRNPVLTQGWTVVVAWANGRTHRTLVAACATEVLVCDRYVLDSSAHLRYRYGPDRRFRLQGALVRVLSPRPAAAFFLDVPPAVARARKAEQYTTADLTRLRALYLAEADRLGVVVVDADRPVEDVAADVARQAWLALAPRRRPLVARAARRAARRAALAL